MAFSSETPTASISPNDLSFLWLEITEKCNLECLHCYANSSPREELFGQMSADEWLTVLQESAAQGCKQVQFIGGEPILHPDLSRMISFASEHGFSFIEVFTNATILNEDLLETFIKFGVQIATSFYSDDPITHDAITEHKGSFNRTVENIKRFVRAGLHVRAGIIEMPENRGHAHRARFFLEGLGVSDINIDVQRGVGRGQKHLHSLQPMSELCGECWKGKLCVTSFGRVYPCVFSRFADLGTVKSGIPNILNTDTLSEFRVKLKEYQGRYSLISHDTLTKEIPLEMSVCSPDLCTPSCSPCGPASFCAPYADTGHCGPETKCQPSSHCSPDTRCGPTAGPCSPDTRCGPSSGPCSPDRY